MELGFRTDKLLMAQFDLSLSGYDSIRARAFEREVLIRARALPGVRRAALASHVPFGYNNNAQRVLTESSQRDNPDGEFICQNDVSPQYFATAGPSIVRGREFTESDDATSPHVAVINEAMARELWLNQDPIGKVFRIPGENEEVRVVGISRNAQYMMLGEPPRKILRPRVRSTKHEPVSEIVTNGPPDALIPRSAGIVRDLDPNVPLFDVRSMTDHPETAARCSPCASVHCSAGPSRSLALALATVGLYGLVSYSASAIARARSAFDRGRSNHARRLASWCGRA